MRLEFRLRRQLRIGRAHTYDPGTGERGTVIRLLFVRLIWWHSDPSDWRRGPL